MHFCDTPILSDGDDPAALPSPDAGRLYSLEDWPLMPSLAAVFNVARSKPMPFEVRVEHFGIRAHFLSLYRTIARHYPRTNVELLDREDELHGEPAPGTRLSFFHPKRLPEAKVLFRGSNMLIEDFFEVETVGHANREVQYRLLDDAGVHYRIGAAEISAHHIRREIISTFMPLTDRKNVHELDKFIGLTRLFARALRGDASLSYPYLWSVLDTLTARRLASARASVLL